jgi:acyl-CoA synthetase (AMP-forming)/AMP-acid ligase II
MISQDSNSVLLISGDVNVYPRDIEEVVVQHPAVQEVAVFGIPHDKWGETPLAAVVLHKPDTIAPVELRDWVNARISAKFQRLYDVVILEEFPRNAAGKTLKRVMREEYWQAEGTKL